MPKKAPPDAIFCPGDEFVVATITATLREAGQEPMRDMLLIGCAHDTAHLRSIHPALPNIDIQPEAIGRTATERLLWRIDILQTIEGASFETAWSKREIAAYGPTQANWIDIDSLIDIKEHIDDPRHQADARDLRKVRDKRRERSA